MSHPAFCGVSLQHLGDLIEELAPRWQAQCESGRHERRRTARRRSAGAGPKYELVFVDRVLATLVHLRTGLTHQALAVLYDVSSSTIGRAITEIRPLLATRGFAVPDRPGVRLHTLDDVFAYAEAEGVDLCIDGTETQVGRSKAHGPGRRAFVSGKRRQNTIKATTISDHQGRTLWSGALRPGRMHDQTAMRTEGIAELLHRHPTVKTEVDEGYRGLANEFPSQVSAPPRKPKDLDNAPRTPGRRRRAATGGRRAGRRPRCRARPRAVAARGPRRVEEDRRGRRRPVGAGVLPRREDGAATAPERTQPARRRQRAHRHPRGAGRLLRPLRAPGPDEDAVSANELDGALAVR